MPLSNIHWYIDTMGTYPAVIPLVGMFSGTNRLTALRALAKEVYTTGVKQLWWNSDYFTFVTGKHVFDNYLSTKTQFIDYVAVLKSITPFRNAATQVDEQWTIPDADAYTLKAAAGSGIIGDDGVGVGAFKNDGNAPAYIYKFVITCGTGGTTITQVEIGNYPRIDSSTVDGSEIVVWTGSLAADEVLTIYAFKQTSDGKAHYVVEKGFPASGASATRKGSAYVKGFDFPWIDAGATDQGFSVKLTGNDVNSTVRAYWHYAYWK
jgi:hypothetical protein